jgi:RecB family endonuclease NucS
VDDMLSGAALRKTGAGWQFASEAALEDFVWANLKQLLGLTPLKQQYSVKGQFCDILAVDENKRLVVLELKNTEDRYIVQQLTRYYDALIEEKPFKEEIDYAKLIGLVAIAPSFHRDNFTDRKYNSLLIELLHLEIFADEGNLYLQLKGIENGKVSQIQLPPQERDISENLPSVPRQLQNFLAKCDKSSDKEREAVLRIRRKILSFDNRMKEVVKANRIEYGDGKSNSCAEFYFSNAFSGFQGRPNLFLKLPEPNPYYRETLLRMHIWTDRDWDSFSRIIYYPRAFISSKNRGYCSWEFPSFVELIERAANTERMDRQVKRCYQNYEKLIKIQTNSLELLVEISLGKWLERL